MKPSKHGLSNVALSKCANFWSYHPRHWGFLKGIDRLLKQPWMIGRSKEKLLQLGPPSLIIWSGKDPKFDHFL